MLFCESPVFITKPKPALLPSQGLTTGADCFSDCFSVCVAAIALDDAKHAADKVKAAIKERNTAKASKDYEKADRIRTELMSQGIELIDKPGGLTDWFQH